MQSYCAEASDINSLQVELKCRGLGQVGAHRSFPAYKPPAAAELRLSETLVVHPARISGDELSIFRSEIGMPQSIKRAHSSLAARLGARCVQENVFAAKQLDRVKRP